MPAKTAKELLTERARIDAAMAQLADAKAKARSHRAEYGKFLQWKVEMQRKERKERDLEEELLRERVEQKLQAVLQQHRQEKLSGKTSYRELANAKVPRQRVLKIGDSYSKENEIIAAAEHELEKRRDEWDGTRLSAVPHSAPTKSRSPKQPTQAPPPATASASQHESIASNIEVMVRDTRPRNNANISIQANRLQALQEELSQTELKKSENHKRVNTMEDMFHKARTRRLYAMGRIAADPPADYLIGTDILKYIPVDLVPGIAQQQAFQHGANRPQQKFRDENMFFMTAVSDHEVSQQAPAPSSDANNMLEPTSERHVEQPASSSSAFQRRKYNPDAWMKLPPLDEVNLKIVAPERNLDEEAATIEWYKLHMRRYSPTKKKSSQLASGTYNWSRPQDPAELSQGGGKRRKSQRFDKI